jgi:hypothetical protein
MLLHDFNPPIGALREAETQTNPKLNSGPIRIPGPGCSQDQLSPMTVVAASNAIANWPIRTGAQGAKQAARQLFEA